MPPAFGFQIFPLRAEERRRVELSGKPTALLSTTDTRKVWQLSPIARRQGVQSGMTVSQAIGLCPTLTILEPDPVYYDEQFASILAALTKISPVVEPVELGRVYVGVDGLERLIGDPAKQLRAIEHVLGSDRGIRRWINHGERKRLVVSRQPPATSRQQGAADSGQRAAGSGQRVAEAVLGRQAWPGLRLGWARGKFASWVAACRAKPGQPVILRDPERIGFLSTQSIAVLPVERDTQRRLWQLGIKTLKSLAALPREAVISQFGREGHTAWQLATGLIIEPVHGQKPPENITTSIEFPLPVADRQILSYAIGKLIERSLRDPRRIGWRVQTLRVRGSLEHGSSWLTEVTLKDPTADITNICTPINTRLEQTPPTGAVENITVEFTSLVRGTSELQLFARDASSAARAGRQKALRWASKEIQKRLKQSMLYHIIEVHPWSRLPERRYALIDYDH